jgi:hypothetical protein
MQPTIRTRVALIPRMVKVLVWMRRLRMPRTVKKLFAKIEKATYMITKMVRGKSLFDNNPSAVQFNLGTGFSTSDSELSFFIMPFAYPDTLLEIREIDRFL